ncbi:MAG: coproporphyrinogen-III oxidase family protein [bacterium]
MIEGLYIHVPFCDGKCHYCAFYSVPYRRELASDWLGNLRREMEAAIAEFGPLSPSTIFFGGGTPTLLPMDQLEQLLDLIRISTVRRSEPQRDAEHADEEKNKNSPRLRSWRSSAVPSLQLDDVKPFEWSCEANPGSLDSAKLELLKSAGVNRISLGVQSLDDGVLRQLGRRHTARDVHSAVAAIRRAGYDNWGLDLIACVPGVDVAAWRKTLQAAVALEPRHISVYALTSEEGTRLARDAASGTVTLLDDDEQLAMLDTAEEVLEAAGLLRYEISNYARPGFECRHNCSCWRGGDYLGLGPAASSRVGNRRWTNGTANLTRQEERLSPLTDATERLVFGLRMTEGIDLDAILAASGLADASQEQVWRATLERLQAEGVLVHEGSRWRLTKRGRALADYVAVELMP